MSTAGQEGRDDTAPPPAAAAPAPAAAEAAPAATDGPPAQPPAPAPAATAPAPAPAPTAPPASRPKGPAKGGKAPDADTGGRTTLSMFLSRALQKILAEKDIKRKEHAALRESCEKALAGITKEMEVSKVKQKRAAVGPDTPMPPPSADDLAIQADKYFTPFRLACQSKNPRFIRTALDSLQKLMAHGHLTGSMLAEGDDLPDFVRLVDLIVDTVCRCFVGDQTDEGVQLQIIKALLTAVTSNTCEVHEGHLLKAIRTCYNIYLASKNLINQTTAKATLTQMISVVFFRMEKLIDLPDYKPSSIVPKVTMAGTEVGAAPRAGSTTGYDSASEMDLEEDTVAAGAPGTAAAATAPAAAEAAPTANGDATPESAEQIVSHCVDELITSAVIAADGGKDGGDDTPQPTPAPEHKDNILKRVEAADAASPLAESVAGSDGAEFKDDRFGHVYRKDAFLVFRSMCKLSMKDLPSKDQIDPRSHELRSKVLSLELQLSILQNAGPAFHNDPLFIEVIKQYLCVALSKNGVSHVPQVFELSLAIFLTLLTKFKSHLKMQIEVFFKEILLSMLEISTSSFQHKWTVMACLSKICRDAQTVIDLYLNYDCDEFLTNIFERMIGDLSKVAQGRASSELGGTAHQEQAMKEKGLECLVCIMRCLDEWSKPLVDEEDELSRANASEEAAGSVTPSLSGRGSQTDLSDIQDISESAEFESRKQKKGLREAGIQLFNKKPKKGLKALQEHGFVNDGIEDVARFLLTDERLSKTAVGEYLGEPGDFPVAVMHAYTDMVDFSKTPGFLDALRLFLSNFRLPGESQKIDRLMEKFAQRYCQVHQDNGVFASADAAYVLAYSVMMLTTDLHSPKVKKKITKEEFLNMTRGINENRDLPKEVVEGIYDAVAKEEIKLKGPANRAQASSTDLQNAKQRQALYTQDMQDMKETAEEQMKLSAESQAATFMTATHVEHVRPMFHLVFPPLLAAFTVPLNATQDSQVIEMSLEGLRISIHIACIFQMELERNAFVQSLAKFTNLGMSVSEIKAKHMLAIRCILDSALSEGNNLGAEWKPVLACISQLELSQLVGTAPQKARKSDSAALSDNHQAIDVRVDKIFTRSKHLKGNAIVSFVKALCAVSMEELVKATPPRMYALSKLVEIAYYNMERIRLEWAHIWAVMGDHFNKVGCMKNDDVAFFAVDSLRQLSMKFLEKGELANYSFQKDFLRPFEYIMNHNKAVNIRDMVVRCVAQMVQSKANNIRSGWKNIFFVFSLAASDNDHNIVDLAFSTTKHIFENYFSETHDHRASLIAASFMDAVNCLSEFACNSYFPETAMEAIRQLGNCAKHVDQSPELFVNPADDVGDEPKIWVKGWFPILFGLSRIVNRCKLDIRTRALQVLFSIMKDYGHNFLAQWWKDLFNVVFRIFDDKKLQSMSTDQERSEWMNTTCINALSYIVDVLSQYFTVLQPELIQDVFGLLSWCIHQNNEQLARSGTESLHILVMNNGFDFTDASWEITCNSLKKLFETTAPTELMTYVHEEPPEGETDPVARKQARNAIKAKRQAMFNSIIIKCVVQLELIKTVEWIVLSSTRLVSEDAALPAPSTPEMPRAVKPETSAKSESAALRLKAQLEAFKDGTGRAGDMFGKLTSPRLLVLLECLEGSHKFARAFNANGEVRALLQKAEFMRNGSKPNLLKQETTSLSCQLRIMFRIYECEERKEIWAPIEGQILEISAHTFAHFLVVGKDPRDVWLPLVVLVLKEILNLDDERFVMHAERHYDAVAELITIGHNGALGNVAFYLAAFFNRARTFKL